MRCAAASPILGTVKRTQQIGTPNPKETVMFAKMRSNGLSVKFQRTLMAALALSFILIRWVK